LIESPGVSLDILILEFKSRLVLHILSLAFIEEDISDAASLEVQELLWYQELHY
jgi:hypothetical protein